MSADEAQDATDLARVEFKMYHKSSTGSTTSLLPGQIWLAGALGRCRMSCREGDEARWVAERIEGVRSWREGRKGREREASRAGNTL